MRLARFDNDRTISFIPPDGEFELMSYRLTTAVKPLIWVETVIETRGRSRVEYIVKAKSQFKTRSAANNVEILIPVPPDVDSPAFKASAGTVTYVPDLDAIKWTIKQVRCTCVLDCALSVRVVTARAMQCPARSPISFRVYRHRVASIPPTRETPARPPPLARPARPTFSTAGSPHVNRARPSQLYGGKEVLMRAHFGLPSVAADDAAEASKWRKRSIKVGFEIPYFTVSGMQVRYLKILEKSGYAALPWVRYITQGGDYEIRLAS